MLKIKKNNEMTTEDKISKIFEICAENHNQNLKVWMFVSSKTDEKRMTNAEIQITYLPKDCCNEQEPYDTKVIIKMDDVNSIDFALKQLQNALDSWQDGHMTFFDNQNNIIKYQHISRKGVRNEN